jgi:hypothetical protein
VALRHPTFFVGRRSSSAKTDCAMTRITREDRRIAVKIAKPPALL